MDIIPKEKRFFRIGEVSKIIGVEPYVLRYWEKEFPQLRPKRADSRHRTYEKKDIELLMEIKRLLYDEKMTIQGAKKKLKEREEKAKKRISVIKDIKEELNEVLKILS